MENIFRALRYKNFRYFFFGQGVSLIGTWMEAIALSWLVYRITGSAFLLGLVGFSSQIPVFILSPIAGVLVDRMDRRRMLIITQTLLMVQAFILAVLTMTGVVRVWHIISLGAFLGCLNAFDMPARQSFVVEMVEKKENLSNAIALNSLLFNVARLIGPSIAGLIIASAGEGVCFLINGVSFFAVIISLILMKISRKTAEPGEESIMEGIKNGFAYTFGFAPIRYILMLVGIISVMGASYIVLMPVFAKDVLKGGASTLGFLMASAGVGALIATVYIASKKNVLGLARMIPIASGIFAIGLAAFSFSRLPWLSFVLLAFSGFGFMTHMACSNTILQTISDDDKRGRVMSLYTMSFIGTAPFGSLMAGWLASKIGATNTIIIGSGCCLAASVAFWAKLPHLRKLVHPIYRKIGIIPEVVSGIGAAARLSVPPED